MAPLRAPTMARQIQKSCPRVGGAPLSKAASTTPIRAKGKAKMVWENLIISSRARHFSSTAVVDMVVLEGRMAAMRARPGLLGAVSVHRGAGRFKAFHPGCHPAKSRPLTAG
jgi:hypothetical protein